MKAKGFICSIEGCDKPAFSRGWCRAHHARWFRNGDPLAGRPSSTPRGEVQRFIEEVVLPYEGDECLSWPFSRSEYGYALAWDGQRMCPLHTRLCEAQNGPRPSPEHEVAHSCKGASSGCCTKRHTRWATKVENQADRIEHGTHNRGEKCGTSKLKTKDVLKIRSLAGMMKQSEIAVRYKISPSHVSMIISRKNWAWLEDAQQ